MHLPESWEPFSDLMVDCYGQGLGLLREYELGEVLLFYWLPRFHRLIYETRDIYSTSFHVVIIRQ